MDPLGDDSDALRTRIAILEAALACVKAECEIAHTEPTIAMTTICRIDSVTRQALAASSPPRRSSRSS